MELAAELAQFNADPALASWVGKLLQQSKNDGLKIQALTLELAHYKRIRFANKSEQFSAERRELFEESWNIDTSAQEAEVEQLSASQPAKRVRAGRQPLPEHLPRMSTAMSRIRALVTSAARISSKSVKTSANNSMSNPPVSSSIATFVRSTPAGPAK